MARQERITARAALLAAALVQTAATVVHADETCSFVKNSGGVFGPHTFYAGPGRLLIPGLSNDKDYGGGTGIVEYNRGVII